MKKFNLALHALIGIKLGLVLSSYNGGQGDMPPEMRTFYEQLDPDAKAKFQALDPEHKKRAMGIVESYCKAYQECKGHREQSVYEQYNHQMLQRQSMQNR
jgi:hypothetical protein